MKREPDAVEELVDRLLHEDGAEHAAQLEGQLRRVRWLVSVAIGWAIVSVVLAVSALIFGLLYPDAELSSLYLPGVFLLGTQAGLIFGGALAVALLLPRRARVRRVLRRAASLGPERRAWFSWTRLGGIFALLLPVALAWTAWRLGWEEARSTVFLAEVEDRSFDDVGFREALDGSSAPAARLLGDALPAVGRGVDPDAAYRRARDAAVGRWAGIARGVRWLAYGAGAVALFLVVARFSRLARAAPERRVGVLGIFLGPLLFAPLVAVLGAVTAEAIEARASESGLGLAEVERAFDTLVRRLRSSQHADVVATRRRALEASAEEGSDPVSDPRETIGAGGPYHVGVLGHVDHGKTTLTAALASYQACRGLADPLDLEAHRAAGESMSSRWRVPPAVEIGTARGRYVLHDFPRHADVASGLISGAVRLDAAILVVSAADGPMPQGREHLALARELGLPPPVVFLSKTDLVDDEELIGLVELEVRELLTHYDYVGDDALVLRGAPIEAVPALCAGEPLDSARLAVLGRLANALDARVPEPGSVAAPDAVESAAPTARIRLYTKHDGGRVTPLFSKAPVRLRFEGAAEEVPAVLSLLEGAEMVMTGDSALARLGLEAPRRLRAGMYFALVESGRDVGAGVLTPSDELPGTTWTRRPPPPPAGDAFERLIALLAETRSSVLEAWGGNRAACNRVGAAMREIVAQDDGLANQVRREMLALRDGTLVVHEPVPPLVGLEPTGLSAFDDLVERLRDAVEDVDAARELDSHSAAARVRKRMQEVKAAATALRKDVTEIQQGKPPQRP